MNVLHASSQKDILPQPQLREQGIPFGLMLWSPEDEEGTSRPHAGPACGLRAHTAPVLGHLEHVRRSGIDLACFLYFG